MHSKIANWVRQARYRAKKHGVVSSLTIEAVYSIFSEFDGLCAYCNCKATSVDHPFPLCCMAPNVPANALPICNECKKRKGMADIISCLNSGFIEQDKFVHLLKKMLAQDGADLIRDHIKGITGIGL